MIEKTVLLKIRMDGLSRKWQVGDELNCLMREYIDELKRDLGDGLGYLTDKTNDISVCVSLLEDTLTEQLAAVTQERDELLQYCREAKAASIIDKILTEIKDKQLSC